MGERRRRLYIFMYANCTRYFLVADCLLHVPDFVLLRYFSSSSSDPPSPRNHPHHICIYIVYRGSQTGLYKCNLFHLFSPLHPTFDMFALFGVPPLLKVPRVIVFQVYIIALIDLQKLFFSQKIFFRPAILGLGNLSLLVNLSNKEMIPAGELQLKQLQKRVLNTFGLRSHALRARQILEGSSFTGGRCNVKPKQSLITVDTKLYRRFFLTFQKAGKHPI